MATQPFPVVRHPTPALATLADTLAWVGRERAALDAQLLDVGAVLFRGFPIASAEDFDAFSAAFGYGDFTYAESLSNAVRLNHTPRVFTANEAPPHVEIHLHHEMAQTPVSPSRLFFYCHRAAASGGATPLCRSDRLLEALAQEDPGFVEQLSERGLRYTTVMPCDDDADSGQGRSWRSTLSVEDLSGAEDRLRALGYDWQWLDNGSLRATTPRLPAVIERSDGRRVLYNQLIAAWLGWPGVREDPARALSFGDGSPLPLPGLRRMAELAERFTVDLAWQDGDVALVDNRLVMHGRRPYSGDRRRQVLVALAA